MVQLAGLILDQTGTEKKGDKSVWVGHQYCGNVGKTANSQVVFTQGLDREEWEEIKYSFTNANLIQYTPEALAYMQAQRFFIEHCIKEAKYILRMDQFQTRKWLAWYHQVALNIMTMCFMLKEKLFCFKELSLLFKRIR